MKLLFYFHLVILLFFIFSAQLISSFSTLSGPKCNPDDSLALLKLKASLPKDPYPPCFDQGLHYTTTSNWRESTNCCNWDGVTCDNVTGHVIGLGLGCGGVQGFITSKSSLFALTHLQSLDLSFNNFLGSPIVPEFSRFKDLTYLRLSSSNFSGDVPLEMFHLSRLVYLGIGGEIRFSESTFKALSQNLTSLRKLNLDGIDFSFVRSAYFANMSFLTYLDMTGCKFHGEFPENSFANMSSLTHLFMMGCKFHGEFPENIFRLPKLQVLVLLQNSEPTGHFPNSNNWTSPLQKLSLSDTNTLSIDLPRLVRNRRSLTDLYLRDCQFTNSFSQQIPEIHIPPNLNELYLLNNLLNGTIPSWIFKLPHLSVLDLSGNEFSGKISQFKTTSLRSLSLSRNMLNGGVPGSMFQNVNLQHLDLSYNSLTGSLSLKELSNLKELSSFDLSSNSLTGSVDLKELSNLKEFSSVDLSSNSLTGSVDMKELSNLKELSILDLSFNNFSLHFNNSINYNFPNLWRLALSSCNISEFPYFLRSSEFLSELDLSSNQIEGSVPKWLWDIGKDSLSYLNLSHNSLTFMDPLPWNNLDIVDLRSNLFSGPIPITSAPFLSVLLGSKNQFGGEISTSFCNLTYLQLLDLSFNNLIGKIPSCFSNFSSTLSVLDLRRNRLRGNIPTSFPTENSLRNLNLNGNQLKGELPRSLMNCSYLEVLDVGNNRLNGTFPDWIESLPQLRVLVLRSNMFHGSIENPKTGFSFQGLRIMDLSNNKFNGPLPSKLFKNFEAMTNAENVKMEYMGENYYQDSIMVTLKGYEIELEKIQTILTTIDFSCNNFTGEIPSLIGKLKALKGLNFSHNMLSGAIPSILGNLTNLEWLDLSSNSLVGKIPWQLASNLYQLQILNLSSNKLEGPIPRGPQFDTFKEDSYSGNLQLCGFPLSKVCQQDPAPPREEERNGGLSVDWKVVMAGYGSGLVIGISIGYMALFSRSFDYWLTKRLVIARQRKINIARSRVGRRRSNHQQKK